MVTVRTTFAHPKKEGWYTCDIPWGCIDSHVIGGINYQIATYWSTEGYVVIGTRTLPNGLWTIYHYDGTGGFPLLTAALWSAHEYIAVALDSAGYIHISWGMHDTAFWYRKSASPIASWNGNLGALQTSMYAGQPTWSATYPIFFKDPQGKLYFTFRSGYAYSASWHFCSYNTATSTWSPLAGSGAAGCVISAPSIGAYQATPTFTRDWDGAGAGFMHFGWIWYIGSGGLNHVRWNGAVFTQWDGTPQTMPCVDGNSRVVAGQGSRNIFAQCFATIDANNHYHMIVYDTDASGTAQMSDVFFDGTAWQKVFLTNNPATVNNPEQGDPYHWTAFGSNSFVPFCDYATNTMHILFGRMVGVTGSGIGKLTSGAGSFQSWVESTFDTEDFAYANIGIDKQAWDTTGDLHVWVCRGRAVTGYTPLVEAPTIISIYGGSGGIPNSSASRSRTSGRLSRSYDA